MRAQVSSRAAVRSRFERGLPVSARQRVASQRLAQQWVAQPVSQALPPSPQEVWQVSLPEQVLRVLAPSLFQFSQAPEARPSPLPLSQARLSAPEKLPSALQLSVLQFLAQAAWPPESFSVLPRAPCAQVRVSPPRRERRQADAASPPRRGFRLMARWLARRAAGSASAQHQRADAEQPAHCHPVGRTAESTGSRCSHATMNPTRRNRQLHHWVVDHRR